MPIQSIILVRRLLYLHEIMSQNNTELINQVYCAMKESPFEDNRVHLVSEDKTYIDLHLTDSQSSQLTRLAFKMLIKTKMKNTLLPAWRISKLAIAKAKDILPCD